MAGQSGLMEKYTKDIREGWGDAIFTIKRSALLDIGTASPAFVYSFRQRETGRNMTGAFLYMGEAPDTPSDLGCGDGMYVSRGRYVLWHSEGGEVDPEELWEVYDLKGGHEMLVKDLRTGRCMRSGEEGGIRDISSGEYMEQVRGWKRGTREVGPEIFGVGSEK